MSNTLVCDHGVGRTVCRFCSPALRDAAGDMLAALLEAPTFGGEPNTAFGYAVREWEKIAHAAIAKAMGETA